MKKHRDQILALYLGCSAILAGIIVAEVAVRLTKIVPDEPYSQQHKLSNPLFEYDPILHWRQRAGLDIIIRRPGTTPLRVHTNALGLRDDELPERSRKRPFDILCLGASPTWGDGIPQDKTYPQVLERVLSKHAPHIDVSVMNGGVPGYSTTQSLELERRILSKHRFDMVTVATLWGDIFPATLPDKVYTQSAVTRWLLRGLYYSHVFRLIRLKWFEDDARLEGDQFENFRFDPKKVHRVAARPDYGCNLTNMVETARDSGAQIVLIAPFPLCFDPSCPIMKGGIPPEETRQVAQYMKTAEPVYRRVMQEVALATETPFVDLAQVLQRQDAPQNLYRDETHPTIEGHHLIASVLAPIMQKAIREKYPKLDEKTGSRVRTSR